MPRHLRSEKWDLFNAAVLQNLIFKKSFKKNCKAYCRDFTLHNKRKGHFNLLFYNMYRPFYNFLIENVVKKILKT